MQEIALRSWENAYQDVEISKFRILNLGVRQGRRISKPTKEDGTRVTNNFFGHTRIFESI